MTTTPFPDYEVEVPLTGSSTTRTTYRIAGQIVAVQTKIGATGTFYFTYTDHLGSVVALSSTAGAFIANSVARHDPFGNYRTTPATTANPTITDHGFTGHRHNNTGSNDLGLIYMNARYFMPEIGRFVSPDSIVPDPANPQSYNRHSYVQNSPMNYTDPSGHCIVAYSGDVRMGDGPYGTSGLCANTNHWITEGNASIEQYHRDLQKNAKRPDGFSIYAQLSPSTQGVEVNSVAGIELVYNRNSHDLTLFTTIGAGGGGSIGESMDVMITNIYDIGDDNLAYSGNAVSVTGGAAYGVGLSAGSSDSVSSEPNAPYTRSFGISLGIGIHGNLSGVENIPIYSVNLDSGEATFHASDYLYNADSPIQNGWFTAPIKEIFTALQVWVWD